MNVFLVSLGCDKNRVDSEEMLGLLSAAGFSFCSDESEADVIVINTCCFIDSAKEESINTILEMAQYKENGKCRKLIVTGCLAQRYKDEIIKELPEVDAIVGVNELPKVITAAGADSVPECCNTAGRVITTGGHFEYLKIAEGCNKCCSYCIIPYIRGRYRSFEMEKLLDEARKLADAGVKELIIVAQETTIYGTDLYGENRLPQLLNSLCEIDGFKWIRVLYTYPEDINDELLEVMAKQKKIVNYIDMPIQHSSDAILKKMGRRTSHEDLVRIINHVREMIPDVILRTSLISGFPGETEEDHKDLMSFVEEIKFDRLGVFTYSQEEGTRAARFENQIPEGVKEQRRNEIMELQSRISKQHSMDCIGREFEVFIEGYLPADNIYVGRTYMDTPDVDGLFYVESSRELMSGDIVNAICTEAGEYDLYGELINESAE